MAAKVYLFHISYDGLEDRIWRTVAVSSNYRLDQLGYLVLALFDTLAYHLFEFHIGSQHFTIPDEDFSTGADMANFRLSQLELKPGSRFRMDYDLGNTQTFWLELVEIQDMKQGQGKRYPYVLDGAGQGIIDDLPCEELKALIGQIDRNGRTDEPFYYGERRLPWDYRSFDLDILNFVLKAQVRRIEKDYAPFWE